ncbi:MAG: three-Cys-motif partner protein TcmP [Phaeodactylibacter sp.]|nr:three-Cys-motif partner protein TcmP [Phaeodactylibacter sp.]MCB9303224.1 three-Cys-motif partner protein TcmP [Lewinellaceae bacterium]
MSKNLHEKPFDQATISKLEIFEDYAQAWIPTFVMYGDPMICIFDFFAGTGYDKDGVAGSPIRILQKLREQISAIFQKKVKVRVFFNEFDPEKYQQLSFACKDFLQEYPELGRAIELEIFNEDFGICFERLLPQIREYSSLVYLDQNGIRFLADKYLLELEKTTRTDFLYFVSSSYFWRFGNKEEFQSYVKLDMEEAKKRPYHYIHRSLIAQLRAKLPADSNLKLYPYSIKKGANIHGIIFGASHPRAVDKFLKTAWKRNDINGEANFDIDEDRQKGQLDIFEGKQLTKIESFQTRLREKVLDGSIIDNFDAYNFALDEAHLGSHAASELKKMKQEGLIDYHGRSPLATYEKVYKDKRRIVYQILQK